MRNFDRRTDVEKELDSYTQKNYAPSKNTNSDKSKNSSNAVNSDAKTLRDFFIFLAIGALLVSFISIILHSPEDYTDIFRFGLFLFIIFSVLGVIIFGIFKFNEKTSQKVSISVFTKESTACREYSEWKDRCILPVKATVVEVVRREHRNGDTIYLDVLEYTFKGKSYKKTSNIGYSFYDKTRIGQSKQVYINPDNPEEAIYDQDKADAINSVFKAFGVIIAILFFLPILALITIFLMAFLIRFF